MTDAEQEAEERRAGYVRAERLGELIGLSQSRIRQLRADGALVTAATKWGKRYKFGDSLVALCKYLLAKSESASEKARKLTAEADYKESKARLIALDVRKREGELHEAEHVKELMNGGVLTTRAALLSLPGRCAHDLMRCRNENEVSECLRNAIYDVLRELARTQYDPEAFRALIIRDGEWLMEAVSESAEEEDGTP